MPAIFSGTQAIQLTQTGAQLAAQGNTRSTITLWIKPSEPQSLTFPLAESTDANSANPRFGLRLQGTLINGDFEQFSFSVNSAVASGAGATMGQLGGGGGGGGGSSIDVHTPGISLPIGQWSLVILERNFDALTLYVWRPGDTDFQVTNAFGCGNGAAAFNMAFLNVGRAAVPGSTRFKGALAFVAGYPSILSGLDKRSLWNAGVPSRTAYESTEIPARYIFPLSDLAGAVRHKFALIQNGFAPDFTPNDSVWPTCGDPIRLNQTFLDNHPSVRAFWTFQEPAPGPFYDRIHNLQLAHDNVVLGNGSPANIARVGDGLFGQHAIRLDQVGLHCLNDAGLLHFPGACQFSVVAWIKTFQTFNVGTQMGLVAGVWEEGGAAQGDRQYALFHSLRDINDNLVIMPPGTVNCHTSNDGGITEPYQFNYEVSASGISMRHGTWQCLAITWDGTRSRSYVNGRFVPSFRNPYEPGYHTLHPSASPFRVGGVKVSGAGFWGNWMNADIGGLAVFDTALSEFELFEKCRRNDIRGVFD